MWRSNDGDSDNCVNVAAVTAAATAATAAADDEDDIKWKCGRLVFKMIRHGMMFILQCPKITQMHAINVIVICGYMK